MNKIAANPRPVIGQVSALQWRVVAGNSKGQHAERSSDRCGTQTTPLVTFAQTHIATQFRFSSYHDTTDSAPNGMARHSKHTPKLTRLD